MGEQLEVQNKQEQIKNSVADKQKANVDTFVGKLKDIKEDKDKTKEVTDVFTDNSDKILEWIKSNMIANFAKIDGKWETDPKLSTYEDAKNAFDTDINKLKAQNIPENKTSTEKASKEEDKLNKLLEITSDIGSLIQLKKLESWKASDADFNLETTGKLKYFIQDNNLEKNMMPKKELKKTRNELINEKAKNIQTKKETEENIKKETEKNITTARNLLSVNYQTQEQTKWFFETSKEEDFNTTLKEIYDKNKSDKTADPKKIDALTSDQQEGRLLQLVRTYANSKYIKDVSIWTANEKFCPSFAGWTRAIQFQKWTKLWEGNNETTINWTTYTRKEKKDDKWTIIGEEISPALTESGDPHIEDGVIYQKMEIIRWNQQEVQTKRANKTEKNTDFEKMRNANMKEWLNIFDNKGNYQVFKKFLDKQTPTFVQANMSVLVDQIKVYKVGLWTDANEHINDLKNWYANVLTDYIIKNPSITETYISYLTTENLNILWVDKTTRTANYNRLFFSDPKNNILRSEINDILNSKNTEDKKAFIMQIMNIKNIIENTDKKTFEKTLSKWLDALIAQFGPLLFSILKMFGLGKWSLSKMFGKDRINKMFLDEYNLKEAKNAVVNISQDEYTDTPLTNLSSPPTAKELKKNFEETKTTKSYIDKLKDNNYYKYINIWVFQQWLNLYNQKNKTEININDILVITTDSTTKKQTISWIKDDIGKDNKDMFTWVIQSILDNDSTWTKIASANEEINTKTEGKVKERWDNEFLNKIDDRYKIENQQDIIRYLTASLFSGKDLSYVMTENELHNKKVAPNNKEIKKELTAKEIFRNKGEKVWEMLSNIDDKWMYWKLDTYAFTGKETGDNSDALKYKTDILVPLQESFIGITKEWTKEYLNYDFLLEDLKLQKSGKKEDNENLMTSIKNMLQMIQVDGKNKDHEKTIGAIQKWNIYDVSVVDKNMVFKIKNKWNIILGVKDKKITTKREATKTA